MYFYPDSEGHIEVGFVFFSDKVDEGSGFQIYWDTHYKFVTIKPNCWPGNSIYYSGSLSHTISGRVCQAWNQTTPHKPKVLPHPRDQNHNHCRNPDFDLQGPWCYTMDPTKRWERCDLDICREDAFLFYLTYHQGDRISTISRLSANPEYQIQLGLTLDPQDVIVHPADKITHMAYDIKRETFIWERI